jgi:hypothetical protein
MNVKGVGVKFIQRVGIGTGRPRRRWVDNIETEL